MLNKVCLHLLPKLGQNLLDLAAYGWTAISAMTIQYGTEALMKKSEFAYTGVLSFNHQFPWQKKRKNCASSHPACGVALRQECIRNLRCLCVIIGLLAI